MGETDINQRKKVEPFLDRQAVYNRALDHVTNPQVKQRLMEADKSSLPPEGGKFDCWMAVNYILGQTDQLTGFDKNKHHVDHLRETHKQLPELTKPKFLSIAVEYFDNNPTHVGLVIHAANDGIYIWSKPGISIARIDKPEEIIKRNVSLRYFDTGLR